MGFPANDPRLRLHTADALDFLAARKGPQPPYDLVVMDAFDGEDSVPAALCTPGGCRQRGRWGREGCLASCFLPAGMHLIDVHFIQSCWTHARVHLTPRFPCATCRPAEFAASVASALHPRHGCFLLNMHSVDSRETIATFKAALLGGDSSSAGGRDSSSSSSDRDSSSGSSQNSSSSRAGSCFVLSTHRQLNVCLVVARGLALPSDTGAARRLLKDVASYVAGLAEYRFPAGRRAWRGYQPL